MSEIKPVHAGIWRGRRVNGAKVEIQYQHYQDADMGEFIMFWQYEGEQGQEQRQIVYFPLALLRQMVGEIDGATPTSHAPAGWYRS